MLTFQVRLRNHPCDLVYSAKLSIISDRNRGECWVRGEGLSLRKKAFIGCGGVEDANPFSVEFLIRALNRVVEEYFRFFKGSD